MRTLLLIPVLGAAISGSLAAQTQYPLFGAADLVKMMKAVGLNVGGLNTSIAAREYETAKERLTRAREQLAVTITFWRDVKRDDAIKHLRTTLAKMDELDEALSADAINAQNVGALARDVTAACEACHAVYREQDPVTKAYRLKLH